MYASAVAIHSLATDSMIEGSVTSSNENNVARRDESRVALAMVQPGHCEVVSRANLDLKDVEDADLLAMGMKKIEVKRLRRLRRLVQ